MKNRPGSGPKSGINGDGTEIYVNGFMGDCLTRNINGMSGRKTILDQFRGEAIFMQKLKKG